MNRDRTACSSSRILTLFPGSSRGQLPRMSENSEHTPEDNDVETKTMEDVPNDSCKSEAKLMNQMDAALLDDEEMPTYISMSSASRPDDSDVTNTKQEQENLSQEVEEDRSPSPYPSDDQAASSVYVLSSGDDTDQHPYNDEDDEDEYSDEMENLELDNEFDPEHLNNMNLNNMKHLMDEEDDDEDDEDEEEDEEVVRQIHDDDDDDDIDNNYRVDYVDIRSDDFILNRKLRNHDKSKSLSLQDLNEYKGVNRDAEYSKRRRSHVLRRNYVNIPQSAVMYSLLSKKQPAKYHHVQSKVKLYIKGIKEQSRRSMERHMKHQENGINNRSNSDHKNSDAAKEAANTATNKTIKDYAERTIKELEIAEVCDRDKASYNVAPIMLNGQDNKNGLESIHEESIPSKMQISMPFESAQNKIDTTNVDDNIKHDYIIGQEHIQIETYHNAEAMDVSDLDNSDTACNLRIENIKSIRTMDDEVKSNNEQINLDRITEEYNKATCEVTTLREKLNRKTVQYNDLLEAYQKQLTENLRMKEELTDLRKSVVKYEKENEPREQKVASIQTDVVDSVALDEQNNQAKPAPVKQSNNKILGNSVVSTLSSIGEWSDSACNLSVSMKPPEAVKTLHSDDSMLLTDGTPGKTTRPLSRAFLTSSRILQTLANITQGKTKPESPLVQNSKKRLNEGNTSMDLQIDDGSYQSQPSSSKKRKIADILGPASFLQSLKASQTAAEPHLRLNESSNLESKFKFDSINDSANEKVEAQESNVKVGHSTGATSADNKTENAGDSEDNVKCFVYHENENSKDRSFLILAEEPEKDKAVNGKGRIRECGPYLLGNVEVRMSEINGTINIWGKEISQESAVEVENEMDTSKVKTDKKQHCWQKTPHTRFNGSNLVCSTGKKLKIPSRFELSSATSNLSCPHTSSFNNTARPSCSTDKAHAEDPYSPSACGVSSCEACDSSRNHSKEWLKHKRTQEKLHSCCIHHVDVEQKYNCFLHKEKQKSFEDNCNCSKERLGTKEHRRLSRNLDSSKHLHENIANPTTEDNEPTCRYHTACRHSSHDPRESCQDSRKCKREDCTCEPLMNTDREANESYINHHSPNVHEEEPLITLKQCSGETPETRRRRLSGRRVRGILMDFLRGCGDCYSPSVSSSSKGCAHKKNSCLTNSTPQIKITPCASPEPTCSNPGQSVGRCCHAYARRIESQLEEFRMEMERVRSRSDAILNMLNMLHSVDMN